MKPLLTALAVVAMFGTAAAMLVAIVLCLAMGANASPAQIRTLKLGMAGCGCLGVMGIGAGIFFLRRGKPGWAAGVSATPAFLMGLGFVVALLL